MGRDGEKALSLSHPPSFPHSISKLRMDVWIESGVEAQFFMMDVL